MIRAKRIIEIKKKKVGGKVSPLGKRPSAQKQKNIFYILTYFSGLVLSHHCSEAK